MDTGFLILLVVGAVFFGFGLYAVIAMTKSGEISAVTWVDGPTVVMALGLMVMSIEPATGLNKWAGINGAGSLLAIVEGLLVVTISSAITRIVTGKYATRKPLPRKD